MEEEKTARDLTMSAERQIVAKGQIYDETTPLAVSRNKSKIDKRTIDRRSRKFNTSTYVHVHTYV